MGRSGTKQRRTAGGGAKQVSEGYIQPRGAGALPEEGTGDVINTNYCKFSVCENRKKNKVIIISAIDNLIKGGSGQAVQNMNIAFKMKETLGLI